ncbi:hypothetical protein [Bacillus subtilis]|uniref:hypothetical protein n=1 Tax=Bacillus subtilis TaxID=1423 RepID=UPI002674B386|nr:hypothetical protein [Bacillus subtilis]MDO3653540.1 hypothetical protein [Bacillus subtilis]
MIWKVILIVFALILVGFIKNVTRLLDLNKNYNFLGQYTENYVKYCNNYLGKGIRSEEENKLYIRVLSDAPKAQRLLINSGYINYISLINTVQLLRNPPPFGGEDFEMLYNTLVMQVSRINELGENTRKETLNPIILLREGVQFFVTLPISLLYWTGLIRYSTQYKLSNNFFIKLINFLIILIGFVSAIVTIVLGWEQFKELLIKFL